jgi:hypothetical protein
MVNRYCTVSVTGSAAKAFEAAVLTTPAAAAMARM